MRTHSNTVSTVAALAAVRRLSFAVLEAAEAPVIYRALASELFAVFGVDQVQVARVSQDHTVGRGNCYRMGDDGTPEMGSAPGRNAGADRGRLALGGGRAGGGTQFDPTVLDALLRVLADQAAKPMPA